MRTPHSLCLSLSLSVSLSPSLSLSLSLCCTTGFRNLSLLMLTGARGLVSLSLHSRRGCGGFSIHLDRIFQGKKRPFFVFLHADEEICIAKGRGGGLAVWKKADKAYREDEGAYA